MIEYIIAGLVTGGIYAIVSSSIVITYTSTGILNFAYAAEAYFVARLFYYLYVIHGWSLAVTAVFCLVVVSPLMGLFLWAVVARTLQRCPTTIKIASTIGLSVAITGLATVLFGNEPGGIAPGLSPLPVPVYKVFGAAVTLNQVIVLGAVALVTAGGWAVLRFTDAGLMLRAVVSSEALTSASGSNPRSTSIGVWVCTTMLAGASGILVAPMIGLGSSAFELLMAASFAAVVAARLQFVGRAAAVGILLGVIASVVEGYVPADSIWASASGDSLPFAVALVALVYYMSRGLARESGAIGGPLDRAISVQSTGPAATRDPGGRRRPPLPVAGELPVAALDGARLRRREWVARILPADTRGLWVVVALTIIASLVLGSYWVGLLGLGLAFATAFLSYTVVTGEGGILSLAQISLACVGAITTAQLASRYHLPVLLAVLGGGIIAAPIGILLALVTARLGDLYVVLVTLMFGVLMDNLVFSLNVFSNYQSGVFITRPVFMLGGRAFVYTALAVFVILGILVRNLRRSTAGLALGAVRSSELGSLSLGLNVITIKALAMGAGAFIAGIAGGMIALYNQAANPVQFVTAIGLTWVAVIVSQGLGSIVAAAIGGVAFAIMPAIFTTYLPQSFGQVPTVMFGVAAVLVARNPEGILALNARQLRGLGLWIASAARRSQTPGVTKGAAVKEASR